MCYSVAQISLTVFMLSGFTKYDTGQIASATEIWMEDRDPSSLVDFMFQKWVASLDEPAKSFIADVRRAGRVPPTNVTRPIRLFPQDFRKHFVAVLDSMINSENALGPVVSGSLSGSLSDSLSGTRSSKRCRVTGRSDSGSTEEVT